MGFSNDVDYMYQEFNIITGFPSTGSDGAECVYTHTYPIGVDEDARQIIVDPDVYGTPTCTSV